MVRYGQLTLIRKTDERTRDKHVIGLWLCDCGQEYRAAMSRVRNGRTTSCGCRARELISQARRVHGMRGSREYSSWRSMKGRCLDPGHKDYPRWGAKGISICLEWTNSFEAFYRDMGSRPPGTTLDRIDNTKGYEPGNCRWATDREQQSNRRDNWTVEIQETLYRSVQEAARAHGVSDTTIMRWCDGYTDARRLHLRKEPRLGCRRWRTYAS